MVNCRMCGWTNDDNENFCANCGLPLSWQPPASGIKYVHGRTYIRCPSCGNFNLNTNVCKKCGKKIMNFDWESWEKEMGTAKEIMEFDDDQSATAVARKIKIRDNSSIGNSNVYYGSEGIPQVVLKRKRETKLMIRILVILLIILAIATILVIL